MSDERFLAELRGELLRAAGELNGGDATEHEPHDQQRRRGNTGRVLAMVGAAALVVAAALLLRPSPDVSADVEIVVDGDDLVVQLTTLEANPDKIEAAAAEFGLDITVTEEPVGPSNVGKFIGSAGSVLPPEMERVDGEPGRFTGFRIPRDWSGRLELSLGRPAEPDERWAMGSDALADGEAAGCLQLLGMTVAEASEALADRGVTGRWFTYTPTPTEYSDDNLDVISDWKVVQASSTSASEVLVQLSSDGSWPFVDAAPRPTQPDC